MEEGLWSELKRRGVVKAATAYAAFVWVVLEHLVHQVWLVPAWMQRVLMVAGILGFPVVVAVAWYFDLTRGGLVRDQQIRIRASRAPLVLVASIGLAVVTVTAYLLAPRLLQSGDQELRTVAVFGFENLSGDRSLEEIAQGMGDELRRRLGVVEGLRVIARESMSSPLLAALSRADAAQRLGATHAVRGTLQGNGSQLRVNVAIERMATGESLWSGQFDGSTAKVLNVQKQVTETVGGALAERLSDEQRAKLKQQPTDNEQAWRLYVRALRWSDSWTLEAGETAIAQLEEATRLDPHFALAFAEIAHAYSAVGQMKPLPSREVAALGQAAVNSALTIDPDLAEGWAMAGMYSCHYVDWDRAKCQRLVQRAVDLDPNSLTAWMYLLQYYLAFDPGNPMGSQVAERMVKLDPVGLWSATIPAAQAMNAYHTLREPELLDKALAELTYARQLGPDFWFTNFIECYVFGRMGRLEEAVSACRRMIDKTGGSLETHWLLAMTLAQAGHRGEALEILHLLEDKARTSYLPPFELAVIHAALGNREECIAAAEQAVRDRDILILWQIDSPEFDFVLDDPRIQAVYNEFGLPRPQVAGRPPA
jgi:TolB-like protein